MTLEEIEDSLPNGLHDAEIKGLAMDYEQAQLVLRVVVLVGRPSQSYPEREACRSGEISFRGVQFYSVDYPQTGSSFRHPGTVSFSYERTAPGEMPIELREALPAGAQCYSFFVRDWLSHIRIAAAEVSFSWAIAG
jgi:hypothetical protein